MNKLDRDYQFLLQDIIDNGFKKEDRTGTGTISVFGRTIRHKMSDGFPLLTTKKMYFRGIAEELLWFLRGDTNIKFLLLKKCNIWNGDAYAKYKKHYQGEILPMPDFIEKIKNDADFANQWGELGPIYGSQWRSWVGRDNKEVDQIKNLVNDLKNNPDSRRLMVSAWNVTDIEQMTLPPCHYGFQCYTRELTLQERMKSFQNEFGTTHEELDFIGVPRRELSLKWTQRSCDTFLGLPFNIASYGLLLLILCEECNMIPGELIGELGDTHLYVNHIEQAKEQIERESFELPELEIINDPNILDFDEMINALTSESFHLSNYKSQDKLTAPLSN